MNENYQTPLFRIALRRSIPVRNRPWNHPFEYTRAEQKRNKPHRTKGRAWKERKKTRSVHSRLSLVAPPPIPRGGTLVFTGVRERDLSAPWEHEKCRSQPTSFWFTVDERQREREREGAGLFWSVETHRSANEVISFSRWGDTHPSSKIAVCCSELARQNKLIGDINEERREVEKWRGGGWIY